MLSPKQAFSILSFAGFLSAPLVSALPAAPVVSGYIPTSALLSTATHTPASSIGGAPYPMAGTTTAMWSGATASFPFGTATGTGTAPWSTGTGSPSPPGNGTTSGKPGLAVWWGQSTEKTSLEDQCADESVDIVILSFVTGFKQAGGFPKFNLNDAAGPSTAQTQAGASDLIDGTKYVKAIKACQASGKKVYVSIGGQTGKIHFASVKEAETAAEQIFNLFLSGNDATTKSLRPFGEAILDGVDLDTESKSPANYVEFVNKLRSLMKTDNTRKYKITAAPQCPRQGQPDNQDASLPDKVLKLIDYVFVQFYNNPSCNHGDSGFIDSVKEWSKAISPAQLWIGAPGSKDGATTGYIPPAAIQKEIAQVKALNLKNFGGYALWDGPIAIKNGNYDAVVKKAIGA